jgi:hypothetical protein
MAITMQTDLPVFVRVGASQLDGSHDFSTNRPIGSVEVRWDKPGFEQVVDILARLLDRQLEPMLETKPLPGGVDAPDEATQLVQVVEIIEFRCTATLAWIYRKHKTGMHRQGWILVTLADYQWRHHRDFVIEEKLGEAMLLVYLLLAPAIRPVKFDDYRFLVLDADLVDAILVAIQSQYTRIA